MCDVLVCGGELHEQTQSDLHASMFMLQLVQSIQHSCVSWMCCRCCLGVCQSMRDGLQLLCELCLPVHVSYYNQFNWNAQLQIGRSTESIDQTVETSAALVSQRSADALEVPPDQRVLLALHSQLDATQV